eukprot:Em0170g2a
MVSVLVDGKALEMEVDTGASVSLISEAIKVIGAIDVAAGYQDQREKLRLIVVAGDGPSLLGRLAKVLTGTGPTLVIVKDELGTIKGVTAKIYMDPAAHPQFFKPRPLPLALKQIGQHQWFLSSRVMDLYESVETSKLQSTRQVFTKLDLANAYLQLMVEEKSKEYLTINTHKGLFRSLATAERNYSQLDKEGLAIIFGVKKFHNYLYGRQFSIVTDHKPLIHLFSENRSIPAMASARLQRWALVLSAYQYKIVYKCGKDNANADMLSVYHYRSVQLMYLLQEKQCY